MPLTLLNKIRRRSGAGKDRLHVGCGRELLPGWINVDIRRYRGIDRRVDVRKGIPFSGLRYIFAEHFIEHLAYHDATRFLKECRRALAVDGVLRLSTPNLDWVWVSQYHLGQWANPSEAIRDCFWMNKAFRGWGHHFLYNLQTLTETLHSVGFATVTPCTYGESEHEALRGIERHRPEADMPGLPHIIVVEASGVGPSRSDLLKEPLRDYRQAIESK